MIIGSLLHRLGVSNWGTPGGSECPISGLLTGLAPPELDFNYNMLSYGCDDLFVFNVGENEP